MKTLATRLSLLAAIAIALLSLGSCASEPVAVPEDLDATTLVQRAQEASDANKYDLAIRYYQALVERYGADAAVLTAGEYEIGFILFKQEKYAAAQERFEAILARYAAPGGEALPPRYKILVEKLLPKIKGSTAP